MDAFHALQRHGRQAAILLTLPLFLIGCGGGGGSGDTTDPGVVSAGDTNNQYPLAVGNRWVYQKTHTGQSAVLKIEEITAVQPLQGTDAYTLQRKDASTGQVDFTENYTKNAQGVFGLYAASDLYLGESRVQYLQFPLTPGRTFTAMNKTNFAIDDLDGDGQPDHMDIKVDVTVEGTESVTVPAGTFPEATRVKTFMSQAIHLTGTGSTIKSSITYTDWYAPGVGRVQNTEVTNYANNNYVDQLRLMAYSVGDRKGSGLQPVVQSTQPLDNTSLTADLWGGTIAISFDQPVDISGPNAGIELVDDAGHSYPGTTSNESATQLKFVTSQLLTPGHYTARLAAGAKDLGGQPISPLPAWSFTIQPTVIVVPPAPDTTPPQVADTFPNNGTTAAVLGTTVSFSFNEDIAPSTFTAQNFLVSENGVALDASKVTVTTESTRTVRLSFPTNYSMPYTVKALAGITDTAGNALVPMTLAFTVADAPPQPVSFYPARSYSPDSAPSAMAMGDVYGTGKNALVLALSVPSLNVLDTTTPRQISIYPQTSDGSPIGNPLSASINIEPDCITYISQVLIGDVTGDDRPDILAIDGPCKKLHIFEQTAPNTWTRTSTMPWSYQAPARLVDLNNDGRLDLVTTDGASHTVVLWYQRSSGGFGTPVSVKVPMPDDYPTNPYFLDMAVGDINGDGRPDIILVDSTSLNAKAVMLLAQRTDGTFSTTPSYLPATSSPPKNVAIGDINGDGRAEVVISGGTYDSGSLAVYTQDSAGQLGQPQIRSGGNGINQIDIVDMNGDGRKDLVLNHRVYGTGSLGIMLQRRDGSLTEEQTTYAGYSPMNAIAIGNLNGDSLPDVALMNYGFFETMSQPMATSAQASAANGRRAFINRSWLRARLPTSLQR